MHNSIALRWRDESRRDLVIIIPGGGYHFVNPREAEPIAEALMKKGFHAAILNYLNEPIQYTKLVENVWQLIHPWCYDRRVARVVIMGFSAGGHLAGLLTREHPTDFAALVLAYPVISAMPEFDPNGSMTNLVGHPLSSQERHHLSLEQHVTKGWPPTFIWSTSDDEMVSIDHSLALITALRNNGVSVESHFFAHGPHGLSLADETTPWDDMPGDEYERLYGDIHCWFELAVRWMTRTLTPIK